MEMTREDVVIVGGGIAGLATALALKRVGIRALVLEKSHELRTTGAALTLFPNAWRALEALGVAHKLTPAYDPLQRVFVTNVATGTTQQIIQLQERYRSRLSMRTVHRKALLEALAEELPPGTIRFSSKVVSVKTQTVQDSPVLLHMEEETIIEAKVLIGCDGLYSVVAQSLGLAAPVNSGRWAVRGLSTFPQGHGHKNEAHQFVGGVTRAGFIPFTATDLYWFIITYKSSPTGGETARDPKLIQELVMENLAKDFPTTYLDVVREADLSTLTSCPLMFRPPWNLIFGPLCKGNITIAGDAMHPMTPDLGQGGCSALEDAVVLGRHIGNSLLGDGRIRSERIAEVLESYVKERRWRVAMLVVGSYLSGWVQQGGSGFVKFIRVVFYGYLFNKIFNAMHYDCGKLPTVSS